MFDTNIFDAILDEKIDLNSLSEENEYYVTHIQHDEIEAISNPRKEERKKRLLEIFEELNKENISTESFVLNISRLNRAKLGKGNLLEKLRQGNLKHTEDALIGETAIKNDITLITNDDRLKNKVLELEGKAKTWDEFLEDENPRIIEESLKQKTIKLQEA